MQLDIRIEHSHERVQIPCVERPDELSNGIAGHVGPVPAGVPIHRTTPDRGTTPSAPGTTFEEDVVISAVVLAAEEGAEAASHLPIPPLAYGLLGFGGLVALLLVTYAFRSVGTRH